MYLWTFTISTPYRSVLMTMIHFSRWIYILSFICCSNKPKELVVLESLEPATRHQIASLEPATRHQTFSKFSAEWLHNFSTSWIYCAFKFTLKLEAFSHTLQQLELQTHSAVFIAFIIGCYELSWLLDSIFSSLHINSWFHHQTRQTRKGKQNTIPYIYNFMCWTWVCNTQRRTVSLLTVFIWCSLLSACQEKIEILTIHLCAWNRAWWNLQVPHIYFFCLFAFWCTISVSIRAKQTLIQDSISKQTAR